ncbi:adenine deaminase [Peptostreptococcaceae bacterium AGR-M142]
MIILEKLKKIINIASKKEKADLVLKNGNIINVFTNEIIIADIAISDSKIAGIGDYSGKKEIDCSNKYISPSFIDSHVHIESSMVSPKEFAKAVLKRGTTCVIADPHEIANVCGLDGIKYILDSLKNSSFDIYMMLPSCVPATNFENSGAHLDATELEKLINHENVLGLGEVMDYMAVINKENHIIDKLNLFKDKIIDGHGPISDLNHLNAYIATGIKTDHECSKIEELINRVRLGMYVQIREGSAAKDLKNLIKAVNKNNLSRILFCTDDRHPNDIINEGHIDNNIKMAIKEGIDPIDAIKMASINICNCYNIKNKGAIAPSYNANLLIIDNLSDFNIEKVIKDGKLIVDNINNIYNFDFYDIDDKKVRNKINIDNLNLNDLNLKTKNNTITGIEVTPNSILTKKVDVNIETKDGIYLKSKDEDVLKIAVIERHSDKKNIGISLVKGFGLKNGAIASTIAHDSHNLIVIGDNDKDMLNCINHIKKIGGGICISSNNEIKKSLTLDIAGLVSSKSLEEVDYILEDMLNFAYSLGVYKDIEPFMTLGFLALPVIPEIRITDIGTFDVLNYKFINQ